MKNRSKTLDAFELSKYNKVTKNQSKYTIRSNAGGKVDGIVHMLVRRFQPRRNAEDRTNEKGGIARWEKKHRIEEKEEELLSEQLKKTKLKI